MTRLASSTGDGLEVPPPLHELEADVMDAVWERGEASVREVMEALNAGAEKARAYTTYMTIMARLHKKGMLVRRREGKTDFYAPAYERADYMALRAQASRLSAVTTHTWSRPPSTGCGLRSAQGSSSPPW